MWFIFVIPFVVFFVIFLLIAKHFFHPHKMLDDAVDMANTVSAYAEQIKTELEPEPEPVKEKICEYCGSTIAEGNSKCDSCGAKIKK